MKKKWADKGAKWVSSPVRQPHSQSHPAAAICFTNKSSLNSPSGIPHSLKPSISSGNSLVKRKQCLFWINFPYLRSHQQLQPRFPPSLKHTTLCFLLSLSQTFGIPCHPKYCLPQIHSHIFASTKQMSPHGLSAQQSSNPRVSTSHEGAWLTQTCWKPTPCFSPSPGADLEPAPFPPPTCSKRCWRHRAQERQQHCASLMP